MLLILPRNKRVTQKNKIASKRPTDQRTTSPVGVTVGGQCKVTIGTHQDILTRLAFEIMYDLECNFPMNL